jgi:LacI family transcriptional regulator
MTIKDVAKRAGVSAQAVSLVLNGKAEGQISTANKERILKVIQATGFRRNINASRVRRSCCETLTLVIDNTFPDCEHRDFKSPGTSFLIVQGIVEGALELGFDVKIISLSRMDDNLQEKLLSHIGEPYSSGVIFNGLFHNLELYKTIEDYGIPHITVKTHTSASHPQVSPAVISEPVNAVQKIVNSLIAAGHTKIAYSSHCNTGESYIPQRFKGYELAMRQAGLYDRKLILTVPNTLAIRKFVALPDLKKRFSAILCMNDKMASLWKGELEYNGYSVPGDFEIVGYDNDPLFPEFASVDLRDYECGKTAAQNLIRAIKEKRTPQGALLEAIAVRVEQLKKI